MIGRRVYPDATPSGYHLNLRAGDYGKESGGRWMFCSPNGLVGDLSQHKVEEHYDRTITVEPSILIKFENPDFPKSWHGYLERGIWRAV